MVRDLVKALNEEPVAGKACALAILVGIVGHLLPWCRQEELGNVTRIGLAIGGSGLVSSILLIAALSTFLHLALSDISLTAQKYIGLFLILLPLIALACQVQFWMQTGETHIIKDGDMKLILRDAFHAAWGFYLSFICTFVAVFSGAARIEAFAVPKKVGGRSGTH